MIGDEYKIVIIYPYLVFSIWLRMYSIVYPNLLNRPAISPMDPFYSKRQVGTRNVIVTR